MWDFGPTGSPIMGRYQAVMIVSTQVIVVTFLLFASAGLYSKALAQNAATLHPELLIQSDLDAFGQDSASRQQVGSVPTAGEFRVVRATFAGGYNGRPTPVGYTIALDLTGLYRAGAGPAVSINQLNFTLPIARLGRVKIGKQRETVVREMIESRTAAPLLERSPSTTGFLPTRNDGLELWNSVLDQRLVWSVAVFNSFLTNHLSFDDNGSQAEARIAVTPRAKGGDRNLLHMALSTRWSGPQNDSLAFKSKPQANLAPNFIDTKLLAADASWMWAGELAAVQGSVSLLSEGVLVRLDQPASGHAGFNGWYVEASWFPRGENRQYDRSNATFGSIDMRGHVNTFELAAEYNATDLSSGSIDGGDLARSTIAANWYRSRGLRASINAGLARLDRDETRGWTRIVIARIQWDWS